MDRVRRDPVQVALQHLPGNALKTMVFHQNDSIRTGSSLDRRAALDPLKGWTETIGLVASDQYFGSFRICVGNRSFWKTRRD